MKKKIDEKEYVRIKELQDFYHNIRPSPEVVQRAHEAQRVLVRYL